MRGTQKLSEAERWRAAIEFRQAHFVVKARRIAPLDIAERKPGKLRLHLQHGFRIFRRLLARFTQQLECTRHMRPILPAQLDGLVIQALVVALFRQT